MKHSLHVRLLPLAFLLITPGGASAADEANGKALAARLCVNCHIIAPGMASGQVTADVPSFMDIAEKRNQTARRIRDRMLNPHPPMPEVQLTNRERADLADYILSLKK
jgi:mono/diheme cytochrome c family protein